MPKHDVEQNRCFMHQCWSGDWRHRRAFSGVYLRVKFDTTYVSSTALPMSDIALDAKEQEKPACPTKVRDDSLLSWALQPEEAQMLARRSCERPLLLCPVPRIVLCPAHPERGMP